MREQSLFLLSMKALSEIVALVIWVIATLLTLATQIILGIVLPVFLVYGAWKLIEGLFG